MTEVATRTGDDAPPSVADYLRRLKPEIQRALPAAMDADRVTRIALTVVRTSELEAQKINKPQNSLARCKPESFAGALLTAAALGLEPGVNGEAYLVPYKGECTLIVGYQGLVKLFWQHPLAKHIDAHAVHERDEFDYGYGIAQFLRHKPAAGNRGPITHFYAVAELTSGASAFVVLTRDEVRELRGREGPSGNIPDPMHWMERKTALRQLIKLLPKSVNLSAAVAVDEHRGTTLVARGVPQAITSGDGVSLETDDDTIGPDADRRAALSAADLPPAGGEGKANRAQVTAIHTLYGKLGLGGDAAREDRLADMGNFVASSVGSTNDLTDVEARQLIDHLEQRVRDHVK